MTAVTEAWLITAEPGAGKSTVARLLAQAMLRAAVITGDPVATFLAPGGLGRRRRAARAA